MEIGKISNELLKKLVIGKKGAINKRIFLSSGVGEDFGAIDFGGEYCIISGDPITGATKNAGKVAIHVACNDIATCGVRPVAVLTTLLLPPGTSEGELGALADEISETAAALDVCVIGGHTEVTDAVTRVVISVTAIGAAKKERLVKTGGALAGDSLVMTGSAAIEGTAILAAEREDELSARFGAAFTESAARLAADISVVEDGVTAGAFGVHAMHDATEGGIFGAAWEMAEASGKGLIVHKDNIPVAEETRAVCGFFDADLYRMVSSGSMLIATDKPGDLITVLGRSGINAKEIGIFLSDPIDRYVRGAGGAKTRLEPPGPDELYKALDMDCNI